MMGLHSSNWIRKRRTRSFNGKLIPGPTVEHATTRLRIPSSPLLEEERHPSMPALVSNVTNPRQLHGSMRRSAFSTDDHPLDAVEADVGHRPKYGSRERNRIAAGVA